MQTFNFPFYKKNRYYNIVVEFTAERTGTVIKSSDSMYPVGFHSTNWVILTDVYWEDYPMIKEYSPDQNGDTDADI